MVSADFMCYVLLSSRVADLVYSFLFGLAAVGGSVPGITVMWSGL